jgi:alpha-ketoglutarate-dependent 2,4-dichlorophenoxyacetate dioxygenase
VISGPVRLTRPEGRATIDANGSKNAQEKTMSIVVTQLQPGFAARVTGLDLRETQDQATVTAINDAINQFGVLVFPGQFITDEQQMMFSRGFGDLETTVRAYRKDYVPRLDTHIADISNLDQNSQVRRKDDRLRLNALGNRLWHSDSSFKRVPGRDVSRCSCRPMPGLFAAWRTRKHVCC